MKYRHFEANYLISLLSSILNQRTPPSPVHATDWRELFYLAEYHDITNIACYALIAVFDNVPGVWKERFFKSFRKWVSIASTQEREVQAVSKTLEYCQIDFILLREWLLRDYYPQTDMRVVKDIEVLIRPEDEKDVRRVMKQLGYHCEGKDEYGTIAYYKTIDCRFVFYQKLFPDNRKLRTYFSKVWKQAKQIYPDGSQYIWNIDDLYIYLVSAICDRYAKEEVDTRDIIDIHLYTKRYKDDLNRIYIDEILASLELNKMAKHLEDLGSLWFGVYEGEEVRDHRDIEEYIWSKGAYGCEISEKLLPMILDMNIWRIKDARRKRIQKWIRWFFPKLSYMRSRFPIVDKVRVLLPLLWIIRLILMLCVFIKIKFIKLYRAITLKLHEKYADSLNNKEQDDYERREEEFQRHLKEGFLKEADEDIE